MSANYIDEYLIKLGAAVDASGMARFHQALREASSVADSSAKSIAGAFFKAQTEVVSGLAAIGGAALGLVDKVAMADQQYRLFALHMYMSKDAARGLKVAMDALGEPLENLAWDAELRARTHQLILDQRAMAPNGDFDAQMRKIRDIRFEFTRMEVEGEYLAMHVVQDFMKALGLGPDELLAKLRGFNDWVTHSLPQISATIVRDFMPVWNDVKEVLTATGVAAETTALAFTNLVGIFDPSVQGTTFNLEKFGKAVADVVDTFATWATSVAQIEDGLMHIISALGLLGHFRFGAAAQELGAAGEDVTPGSAGVGIAGLLGSYFSWKFSKLLLKRLGTKAVARGAGAAAEGVGAEGVLAAGAEGAGEGAVAGPWGALGGFLLSAGGTLFGSWLLSNLFHKIADGGTSVEAASVGSVGNSGALLDKYARAYGIDPAVVRALAHSESHGEQNAVSSTGALGIMQLLPSTAHSLGVNPYDADDNVRGGVAYFSRLLHEYGTVPNAVAAYHEGEPKMNAILAGRATLSSEGRGEVAKVMRQLGARGDVQVGSIIVNVNKPNAVNADVGEAVAVRLRGLQDKRTQRNLSEFQGLSWGY